MRFHNVTLAYGARTVLEAVDFEIKPGEFVFLIGSSGVGKSTLTKALSGALAPTKGSVLDHAGRDVYLLPPPDLAQFRRKCGVVFQDYKLLRSRTVGENVAFALEACGFPERQVLQRVPEVLAQVGLLGRKDRFPHELSGGELQRAAVARALVHDPDVIVGDEPTGNLDPENAASVLDLLDQLNKKGKTVIVATHDEHLVARANRRTLAFRDRRLALDMPAGKAAYRFD